MRKWSAKRIAHIVNGEVQGNEDAIVERVILDSRKSQTGDLFVPLCGENFDGHRFLNNAFENGASVAFSKPKMEISNLGTTIIVDNPLLALQQLGTAALNEVKPQVVAVTGSTGKTSTKEMIYAILSQRFNTFKTKGNLNSEQGLPMALYSLQEQDEIAVLEMGMRGRGQITELVNIAKPDIAVITNIGTVHLELLGSQENLALAKGEILEGINKNGLAVLNGDDKWCRWLSENHTGKMVFYGLSEKCDIRAVNLQIDSLGRYSYNIHSGSSEVTIKLPIPGKHHVYNSLAAIAIALHLGMSWDEIIAGVSSYKTISGRQLTKVCAGVTVIDDSYNSNPQSIRAGLELLKLHPTTGKRIAVLGDMRELGDQAIQSHLFVGEQLFQYKVDILICNGALGAYIGQGAQKYTDIKIYYTDNNQQAVKQLKNITQAGDVVLIKGSRGLQMEHIVSDFCKGL
ncbi:UDP-N-acetylmuramoyl-tripeptide--D-alanyl-D-alanine ligase [Clostridium sp. 'deep sea']|uniref:UDP-N-acetylmuramoyl-tripeptide--D-alanyl-D- alanine ligase n=1 Tax=Clostridium sp. 'deep sea' TaxID=2779445 RepID=UPI001896584C|nr:UDP-N-acetylmuramoyl-tripeptide--D-alanyl-D-alanine ligase [Clostridium sp. 'deep sea']QOR36221.1 UDP-N-acetylmuramoyl-tripeptide--D-alanyl-D-alanine ligase [Clostridium sp. 'deep sea']